MALEAPPYEYQGQAPEYDRRDPHELEVADPAVESAGQHVVEGRMVGFAAKHERRQHPPLSEPFDIRPVIARVVAEPYIVSGDHRAPEQNSDGYHDGLGNSVR